VRSSKRRPEVAERCRKYGVAQAMFYRGRPKYGGADLNRVSSFSRAHSWEDLERESVVTF